MAEGMEWRPTPRPKEDARRKGDTEMGERMVRVEEGVNDLQSAVDRQGEAITRLHERVDEMNATLTSVMEGLHDRVSNVTRDVERSLDAHISDEEKLTSARFDAIRESLQRVEDSGKVRMKTTVEAVGDLKHFIIWITGAALTGLVALVAYVISFLVDHASAIGHFIQVFEKIPVR